VNWLNNGQGNTSTESGAYTLLGGTPTPLNAATIVRQSNARWFLPTDDEWHKAAYHKNDGVTGNYWGYPTASDSLPDNNLPTLDSGNSANFNTTTGDNFHAHTDAGSYRLSQSAYGTLDQAGNVFEWTENFIEGVRGLLGGDANWSEEWFRSGARSANNPVNEVMYAGIRVASSKTAPGDFNFDGVVDGADFLDWQRGFSPNPLSPIEMVDWRNTFGLGATGLVTSVPEPRGIVLGCVLVILGLSRSFLCKRDSTLRCQTRQ
jgi:hypothetical protein